MGSELAADRMAFVSVNPIAPMSEVSRNDLPHRQRPKVNSPYVAQ